MYCTILSVQMEQDIRVKVRCTVSMATQLNQHHNLLFKYFFYCVHSKLILQLNVTKLTVFLEIPSIGNDCRSTC